jgi:hypothetical protein
MWYEYKESMSEKYYMVRLIDHRGRAFNSLLEKYLHKTYSLALDPSEGSLIAKLQALNQKKKGKKVPHYIKEWLASWGQPYIQHYERESSRIGQFFRDFFSPFSRLLFFLLNIIELMGLIAIGLAVGIPTIAFLVATTLLQLVFETLNSAVNLVYALVIMGTSLFTGLLAGTSKMKSKFNKGQKSALNNLKSFAAIGLSILIIFEAGGPATLRILGIMLCAISLVPLGGLYVLLSPLNFFKSLVRGAITIFSSAENTISLEPSKNRQEMQNVYDAVDPAEDLSTDEECWVLLLDGYRSPISPLEPRGATIGNHRYIKTQAESAEADSTFDTDSSSMLIREDEGPCTDTPTPLASM